MLVRQGAAGTGVANARGITDYWNQLPTAAATGSTNYQPADADDNVASGSFFEDAINTVARELYTTGGLSYNMGNSFVKNANMMVMSPAKKVILDGRLDAHTNARRDIGNAKMLNTSYKTYGSSFGDFAIVPDVHCDTTRCYVQPAELEVGHSS